VRRLGSVTQKHNAPTRCSGEMSAIWLNVAMYHPAAAAAAGCGELLPLAAGRRVHTEREAPGTAASCYHAAARC
jgi:hypothetical protein